MRLRTYNSRRKRLFCRHKEPKGEPFCYIVYSIRYPAAIRQHNPDGSSWIVNWEARTEEKRRPFPDYPEAIAHLTRIKLAIDEEDQEWRFIAPCKIVEGMYTRSGKEVITKTVRLNDECDRPPERHFSSGLPCQQRGINFPVSKIVGNPYRSRAAGGGYYTNPYVESNTVRSSGATTSSSTATGVDARWYDPEGLSF